MEDSSVEYEVDLKADKERVQNNEDEYLVEKIVCRRRVADIPIRERSTFADAPDNEWRYLVRWEHYPPSEDTWEPKENLESNSIFLKYLKRIKKRHELKRKRIQAKKVDISNSDLFATDADDADGQSSSAPPSQKKRRARLSKEPVQEAAVDASASSSARPEKKLKDEKKKEKRLKFAQQEPPAVGEDGVACAPAKTPAVVSLVENAAWLGCKAATAKRGAATSAVAAASDARPLDRASTFKRDKKRAAVSSAVGHHPPAATATASDERALGDGLLLPPPPPPPPPSAAAAAASVQPAIVSSSAAPQPLVAPCEDDAERRTPPEDVLPDRVASPLVTSDVSKGGTPATMIVSGKRKLLTVDLISQIIEEEIVDLKRRLNGVSMVATPADAGFPLPCLDLAPSVTYQAGAHAKGDDAVTAMNEAFRRDAKDSWLPWPTRLRFAFLAGDVQLVKKIFSEWLRARSASSSNGANAVEATALQSDLIHELLSDTEDRDSNVNLLMEMSWRRQRTACDESTEHVWCSLLRLLLEAGAASSWLNRPTKKRHWTPLFVAVHFGTFCQFRTLIEAGACTNLSATDGATPLHLAVCRGDARLMRNLVWNGADLNAEFVSAPGERRTPDALAAELRRDEMACELASAREHVRQVLERSVRGACGDGLRPLRAMLPVRCWRPAPHGGQSHGIEFTLKDHAEIATDNKCKPILFIMAGRFAESDKSAGEPENWLNTLSAASCDASLLQAVELNGCKQDVFGFAAPVWWTKLEPLRLGVNGLRLDAPVGDAPPSVILFAQPWLCTIDSLYSHPT